MYYEHPFKIDGVYYAKIDGAMIEISEELANGRYCVVYSYTNKEGQRKQKWRRDNNLKKS